MNTGFATCPFCGGQPKFDAHTDHVLCTVCKFSVHKTTWQSRRRWNLNQPPDSITLTMDIAEDGKLYSYRHESTIHMLDNSDCDIIGLVAKDMYRHLSKSLKLKEKKDEYERL